MFTESLARAIAKAFTQLFAMSCVVVGVLLGLFAVFGFFVDKSRESRTVAGVMAGVALLTCMLGFRCYRAGKYNVKVRSRRGPAAPPQLSASKPSSGTAVLVVVNHPHEINRANGLRFHFYECAGVKSGRRSGCVVQTMPLRQAEAEGRTICAFCAEGSTDDPFYKPSKAECDAVLTKWPQFARLQFGYDAPTKRQFAYAIALGAKLKSGVTFTSISKLIDKAKASGHRPKKSERPSDEEAGVIYHALQERGPTLASMLKRIRAYHGVLPREVSPAEARRIIEFLEDHYLPCPFCGIEICAMDRECCICRRSLRCMQIPIKL